MIVWGGAYAFNNFLNTGGRYNPNTDSWTPIGTMNAPTARNLHTAIWTGTEMLVWGGYDLNNSFNTGGRYNPNTDSWTTISTTNAPTARNGHTAIWTGSEMIVWGGGSNTGGRYSSATNSWIASSTTSAPAGRIDHTAVWTGGQMIIWGGYDSTPIQVNTGGRYCASTPAASIQFSSATNNVGEGDRQVNVSVIRSGNTGGAASVSFATSDSAASQNCNVFNGQASSQCDYISSLGTLNFAPGESSKTISVLIINDAYAEGPENFSVNLSSPTGASLAATATATVTINDNDATTGANPIDQAGFFVTEHYYDFLNRLPDASGLTFWTNEITSCGTDQACIALKHINVSAAFFLSIEFQQTGYLVERMYKAAYGDAIGTSTLGGAHQLTVPTVRYTEFLTDTQQIGLGVIVGQAGWEQVLANNKQSFAAQFVLRTRFTDALATTLTPAQFVDKLFMNASVTPSSTDRNAAIAEFGSATNTTDVAARARALRDVSENSILNQQEFNRAFVLMQFFGYLRRNPNDSPDSDYTGYDFWLTKLNQFNGNFVNAEMVKAFINSTEYRQRFGP